jgi:hypothetical protein
LEGASEVELADGREEGGGTWGMRALKASPVEAQGLTERGVAGEKRDDGAACLDGGGATALCDDAEGGLGGAKDLGGVGVVGELTEVEEVGWSVEVATKGGQVGSREGCGDAGGEVRAEDAQAQRVGEAAALVLGVEVGAMVRGLVEEVGQGAPEVAEGRDGAVARRIERRCEAQAATQRVLHAPREATGRHAVMLDDGVEVGVDDTEGEQAFAPEVDERGRKEAKLRGRAGDPAVGLQAKRDVVGQHAGSSSTGDAGC